MLPPKRELPFKVPSTISETGRKGLRSGRESPKIMASNPRKSASLGITGPTAETKRGFDHESSEIRRTAPAKRVTRATRGSRNGATASSSRKRSSALQDGCAVPSVEELLRRSQRLPKKESGIDATGKDAHGISAVCTTSALAGFGNGTERDGLQKALSLDEEDATSQEERPTAHQQGNIDTQALLARVDERLRRQETKRKDHTESLEEPSLLPPSKRAASGGRLGLLDLHSRRHGAEKPIAATESERTGDSSLRNVVCAAEATSANTVHDYKSQEYDSIPPSTQEAIEEVQARLVGQGHLSPRVRQPSSNISSLTQPSRPQASTTISAMALMRDPDFARAPEIAEWAELPSEERDTVLESWMCEQLESESFATLLKTLEGMWQRVFLGR
jgi:hypothetical protein